ncbi:MAG: lysylphosphatidylglycerol synthase transmembrane domain-containing protein [Oscillospiraceae bacterium]
MNESENPKKKTKKRVGLILFILLNVAVIGATAYIDFGTEKSVSKVGLEDINLLYLLAVLGCFVAAILAETAKYCVMIKHTTGRASFREGFEVAALGKYYDNITPFGAGGQPFQVVYLLRRGISPGAATAMPIAGFLTLQGAFVILAAAAVFLGGDVLHSAAARIPAVIGFIFYVSVPLAILFFAISPALTERILAWGIRIFAKLGLVKDAERRRRVIIANLHSSIESMSSIFRERFLFLKILALSLLFQLALCSMPYFVLRAFGNTLPYLSVFRSCIYIYLCITFVPTPGNSGVAEGSFYALFSVLGQGHLFWAMLVWRFFCYYSFLITGLFAIGGGAGKKRRESPEEKG